jgi:RNA polymerase sigma factor (sigma-70 family)
VRPFEEIVGQYGPVVLRVCRAVLGPVDADDAWSETFLAALRAYPELPADANVEAWLVTIAHRKAIDGWRAGKRRPLAVAEVPETAVTDEGRGEIWDAVAALPHKQRLAVAYHHLAGLSYREIAAITGGTEAAARRAAADGMKRLRATVEEKV